MRGRSRGRVSRDERMDEMTDKLFLVIDDGSGEGTTLVLADDATQAAKRAQSRFGYADEEPGDLRAVCAETAKSAPVRALIAFLGEVADAAMTRGAYAQTAEDALNGAIDVASDMLAVCDRRIATARAETALAEREACAEVASSRSRWAYEGAAQAAARGEAIEIEHAIRARTTSATLSTETLAAIAEARGLRVVEPELLEGLEPPALRWDIDEHSTARVGPWSLEASALGWSVYVESPLTGRELIADECTDRVERSVNRRAAEAALRSLGVAFRVEDGGAK